MENHGPRARISEAEIRTTAEMARLSLTDAELAQLAGELSKILAYADDLAAVDVTGIEPTTHAVPLPSPLRDDQVGAHDPPETAMRNAPAREADFFAVPAVFGSGGEAGSDPGHESEG